MRAFLSSLVILGCSAGRVLAAEASPPTVVPEPAHHAGSAPAPVDPNKPVTISAGQLQALIAAATMQGAAQAQAACVKPILDEVTRQAQPTSDPSAGAPKTP